MSLSPGSEALLLDLVEWVARGPRRYEEVMDAWRTSCPRMPVWEEANDRGFVRRVRGEVHVTDCGRAYLRVHGREPVSA
jgi:hypothetical protein